MAANVINVTVENFQEAVLEASFRVPVLLDFWAPWCGPCRTLIPTLEKLAAEFDGRFILAKANADEHPQLSAQFGVRGIPAVKAVVEGQVVDEFTGAQPETVVREFLHRLLPSESEQLRVKAGALAQAGQPDAAIELLRRALTLDAANDRARLALAHELMAAGDDAGARQQLAAVAPVTRLDDAWKTLDADLRYREQAADLPALATLQARIAANADDLEARLALANACVAQRQYEPALEQFIEIVRRDRTYRDDIGRKSMLEVFALAADQADLVSRYRRLLAASLH